MTQFTKNQIIEILQPLNVNNGAIFKSKKETDFSLTQHGYILLTASKLYVDVFVAKLDKDVIQTTSVLLSLKKIFNSPYLIKGCKVFYFDEIIHAEICIHNSLEEFVKHQKIVDKFNK